MALHLHQGLLIWPGPRSLSTSELSRTLAGMFNRKYNCDLRDISARTRGKCHLCHDDVDLDTYGRVSIFGPETASVDHLIPQSHGGGHDHDNLRIAHQGCNSRRGTRDPVEVRKELSGRSSEPLSNGERFGVILLTGLTVGLVGAGVGAAASNPRAEPAKRDQAKQGAIAGGLFLGLLGVTVAIAATA